MKKRCAPIFQLLAFSLAVTLNAAPILNEPLRQIQDIEFIIKPEGRLNNFIGGKAKVFSFDTGAESDVQLNHGKLEAIMSLPVDGPDPINIQVAGILKTPDGSCELNGAQDILLRPGMGKVVLRTVCEQKNPAQ